MPLFRSHTSLLVALTLVVGACLSACLTACRDSRAAKLRQTLDSRGIEALERPEKPPEEILELGEALFFDPVLSGNRDIACATCHHPKTHSTDGRSLSVGTGAVEQDGRRVPGPERQFVPRNATDVFNRGHEQWTTMFWDGRVHRRDDGRFVFRRFKGQTSAKDADLKVLPELIDNIVAAQAMVPNNGRLEMRGTPGDKDIHGEANMIGALPAGELERVWELQMERLGEFEAYREMFAAAYPDTPYEELHFAHAANAIAAFEIDLYTFMDAPFDRFLAGEDDAMSQKALRGAQLFYGEAGCASCHSGALLTDQKVHNIGVPQIGPGKMPGAPLDQGAALRRGAPESERFAFRTPPLRNVELTGPWMHNGAYTRSLEQVIRHHMNPEKAVRNYDPSQLEPRLRAWVHTDRATTKLVFKTLSEKLQVPDDLTDEEVGQLVAFLKSLTSPTAENRDPESVVPESVPSGLEMVEP